MGHLGIGVEVGNDGAVRGCDGQLGSSPLRWRGHPAGGRIYSVVAAEGLSSWSSASYEAFAAQGKVRKVQGSFFRGYSMMLVVPVSWFVQSTDYSIRMGLHGFSEEPYT